MDLPKVNYTDVEWVVMTPKQKVDALAPILDYLNMIEDGEHPLYKTHKQGKIGVERRTLEKFLDSVIMWESKIKIEEETEEKT